MNVRHVFSALFLFGMMSCVAGLGEPSVREETVDSNNPNEKSKSIDFGGHDAYPTPSHPDPWDCGTEIIKAEGPDGSIYFVEVPVPCDPMQDEYKGCPAEKISVPGQENFK